MPTRLTRRDVLAGAGAVSAAALVPHAAALAQTARDGTDVTLGYGVDFSFERLQAWARDRAAQPFRPAPVPEREILEQLDYDPYQKIRFRADKSLRLDRDNRYPIQLFHPGKFFKEPVRIFVVDGVTAREAPYSAGLFEMPAESPARALRQTQGFAGFRVMSGDLKSDWLAFLGASYFRTSGPYGQYGLSARGLAIDTGLATPEEFPRFTDFWLDAQGAALNIYALLDSPSVSGAYLIKTEHVTDARGILRTTMEIDAHLYARADIRRLGIAPFSSMYWYSETSRRKSADWRPEIHDSDGLALYTGSGERIWRPLNNPDRVTTNVFVDNNPRGFGLLQRDRDFVHYLDDGVFYERRPSVWVEPLGEWGAGAVHLLEIPTDDEIHDNIAAYWCPDAPFRAGESRRYRYRLSWVDDVPFPETLGRVTGTWTGMGGRPGQKRPAGVQKFVIDWQGAAFAGLGREDGVEIVVTTSRGEVSNAYTHPVVGQRERWRALFDLSVPGRDPADLRAFLKRGDTALTETWLFQHLPAG